MSAEPADEGFAAFATFLGTPLPENPIEALRILRREAVAEIERLIAFVDALGGEPDLEDGADGELWLAGFTSGDDRELDDAEEEPNLASPEGAQCPDWPRALTTCPASQARWARGNSDNLEGDAAEDDEDCHDVEDDKSDYEPDADGEPYLASSTSEVEGAVAPSKQYAARLRARRPRSQPIGFCNVTELDGSPVKQKPL
jgi:hypothetical protein